MAISTRTRADHRSQPDELALLWHTTERLLADADVAGIRAHKLGALAARHRRQRGRPVAPALAADERAAAAAVVMARPLLQQITALCDGPLVLFKGPEVARLYPGSARTFGDIDLLVVDAPAVQQALIDAGFVEVDDPDLFVDHHHLRPLKAPVGGLKVEVHTAPLSPAGPPTLEQILARAVPAGVGVKGLLAPHPVHHAVILAGHAWNHDPLRSLRDLIDIAAMMAGCSDADLARTAEAWELGRVWQTTHDTIEALLGNRPAAAPLRLWARHLPEVRERNLLDNQMMRWLHPFWAASPGAAIAAVGKQFHLTFLPAPGESWRMKLLRTYRALAHPRESMSSRLAWVDEVHRRRNES